MTSANDEEKVYLETKLVDFKIYTTQHLAHSVACARAITSLTEDVSSYTL